MRTAVMLFGRDTAVVSMDDAAQKIFPLSEISGKKSSAEALLSSYPRLLAAVVAACSSLPVEPAVFSPEFKDLPAGEWMCSVVQLDSSATAAAGAVCAAVFTLPGPERAEDDRAPCSEAAFTRTLIRILSHDLRTPFMTASHFFSILPSYISPETSEKFAPLIAEMSRIFVSSKLLLDNVQLAGSLQYAVNFREERLSLKELLETAGKTASEALSRSSKGTPHFPRIKLEEDVLISGDVRMLSLVMRNLAAVCLAHADRSRPCTISAAVEEDAVHISFRYTGLPVSQSLMEAVSHSDWGREPEESEGVHSVGLFLHTAQQLLHLHQSAVTAESVIPPGFSEKRADCTIRFPLQRRLKPHGQQPGV